ncbi:unnamed protein product, partial [Closterium sp. NIES-64]
LGEGAAVAGASRRACAQAAGRGDWRARSAAHGGCCATPQIGAITSWPSITMLKSAP